MLLQALDRNYSLVSQPPPQSGNVPLQLSRVQNLFTDISKMKCTYGTATSRNEEGGNARELYYWSKQYNLDPDETEHFITTMYLRNLSYYGTRPIQFDVQFIGLFYARAYAEDGSGTPTLDKDGWILYKLGDKQTLTQDLEDQTGHQWKVTCHYGGKDLATTMAGLIGASVNPSVPENGEAYFRMELRYTHVCLWPKYLQL